MISLALSILFTVLLYALGIGGWFADLDPGWIALIASVAGGVSLKVVEKWLNRNVEKRDDRKDFREELAELRTRLDAVEKEVDEWRGKYYTAQEEILALKTKMAGLTPPWETPAK
jgi:hypothetical protein